MKEIERIKRRITEIEYEVMRCNDLPKIWKLKKEHRDLNNTLKRIIRKAES